MTDTYKEYKETGDKNIFEDIIDKMILDQVAGMNESFRRAISSLPKKDKRMAILSLLDKDRNLFTKIKDSISNESLSKLDHVKDIVLMLREYVKIAEVEKKKFGEVMTPLDLVKEMLATLPKEVWSNPDLKWLDPANGTGPYPIMVIYKLMIGLQSWEPNEELRYKHIIENMIYVCEIQPKNQFLFLCAIDPKDEYICNIYTGSFLEEGFDKHMKEVWNVDKFDIVIGNPPYQQMDGGNRASAKPLYNVFIEKSITLTDIITMIVPSRWFAGGKGLDSFRRMMINSNSIKLLKHYGNNGIEIFGKDVLIGGGVSYFLFDKNHNSNKFIFNGVEVTQKYDIIVRDPYCYKLIDKLPKNCLDSISKSRSFYNIATNDSRFLNEENENTTKCYVSKQKGFTKHIKKEDVIKKCDLHKVVTPRAYMTAEDGLGNIFYATPDEFVSDSYMFLTTKTKEEAESLITYLKTKFVKYLVGIRKIDSAIKPDTFKWTPIVPLDREWTDEMLFEYFELTKEEIELINSVK